MTYGAVGFEVILKLCNFDAVKEVSQTQRLHNFRAFIREATFTKMKSFTNTNVWLY